MIRRQLGEVLLETDSAAAAEQFEELIKHRPADVEVVLGLAKARLNLGQLDEAGELLDRLITENPDHVVAMTERGRLAMMRSQPAEAEKWLRQALALAPYDRAATYRLLRCLQAQGKSDEVARVKDRLAQIDADLARMNKLMPQIIDRPGDADLRTQIGKIFLRNGMDSDGVRWLNTALEYAPMHAEAHQALAEYHERQGNKQQAKRHRQVLAQLKTGSGSR
jgi:predicted Zn-dependent protease